MDKDKLNELLFQALETERGGIQVYESAVTCAQNDDLRKEWTKYLEQTTNHEVVMLRVLDSFGLDADTETPGRSIVRQKGQGLVKNMQDALAARSRISPTRCRGMRGGGRDEGPHELGADRRGRDGLKGEEAQVAGGGTR